MLYKFCPIIATAALCFAWGATAFGQLNEGGGEAEELRNAETSLTGDEVNAERAREGTQLIRQLGRFTTTGDRLTFHVAGSETQYLGLENLALERIGKVLVDRRDQANELQWEVTGVLTEYRGTNYLLVTRALVKAKNVRGSSITNGAQ